MLFHAAAGGVGLIACQWARALGLQLIGTAGSDAKCQLAREHGAAHTINYATEDFLARVKEITGGRGVKVVYDSVGKDTWDKSLDCLQPFGLMASFGAASGPPAPFAPGLLGAKGSLYVTRQTLFTHIATRESTQAMADDCLPRDGGQVVSDRHRYPLDSEQARRDLERARRRCSSHPLDAAVSRARLRLRPLPPVRPSPPRTRVRVVPRQASLVEPILLIELELPCRAGAVCYKNMSKTGRRLQLQGESRPAWRHWPMPCGWPACPTSGATSSWPCWRPTAAGWARWNAPWSGPWGSRPSRSTWPGAAWTAGTGCSSGRWTRPTIPGSGTR